MDTLFSVEMTGAENSVSREISRPSFFGVTQHKARPLESQGESAEKPNYSFSLPNSTSVITIQNGKHGRKAVALDYKVYLSGAVELSTGVYLFETERAGKRGTIPPEITGYFIIDFPHGKLDKISQNEYWRLYHVYK